MRLRRQIAAGLALLLAAIAAAVVVSGLVRTRQAQAEASFTRLAAQELTWRAIQATLAEDLRDAARAGQPLDLLDRRIAGATRFGPAVSEGLERIDGRLLLVAVQPLPEGGVLVAGMAPDLLLTRAAAATGALPVLTDLDGRPQTSTAAASPLAAVADRLRGLQPGLRTLMAGDRTVEVATVAFRDGTGQVIGARRWLNDVTERRGIEVRNELFASAVALALALLMGIGALLWLRQAFRPLELVLAAQHALAAGDLSVELRGEDRKDEVGRAVRALQVFRESRGALRRMARADARQRRIRLRFIEAELGSLAETMEAADKARMEQDLREVLAAAKGEDGAAGMDALALAFHVMSERVRSQHEGLRGMIEAQRDALATKARMEGLQQELSAVATMQARMVPGGWPAGSGAAVGGRLLQGAQYGGDFQDFFWLDGPQGGRLAVFIGSVHGAGLAAGFLAISARALVRALAPQAASPGACLSRVSDLLLGDNAQRMEISGFLGIIDLRDQVLVAARAAGPPPLVLLRPGEARVLDVPGAAPMGLQPGMRVPDTTIDLPSRAALVAVSRGMPQMTVAGRPLGMEGLAAMLAESPGLDPETMLDHVANRLSAVVATGAADASLVVARPHAGSWQQDRAASRGADGAFAGLETAGPAR